MDSLAIVTLMNREDHKVTARVAEAIPAIACAVDAIVGALKMGGRLIYIGAGTSGRLGVLDASECPPTFGTHPDTVVPLLAGGENAIFHAVEGAEDDADAGEADLQRIGLTDRDVVVGISASGRTPYVLGALTHARSRGITTVAVCCNMGTPIGQIAHIAIEVNTGPEILGGSTRLKAGTAQKMVLNMLSTASMVHLGKVYTNLMVDVTPTNAKLVDRACRILTQTAGVDYSTAVDMLKAANYRTKVALVMAKTGLSAGEAQDRLDEEGGFVRAVLESNK